MSKAKNRKGRTLVPRGSDPKSKILSEGQAVERLREAETLTEVIVSPDGLWQAQAASGELHGACGKSEKVRGG